MVGVTRFELAASSVSAPGEISPVAQGMLLDMLCASGYVTPEWQNSALFGEGAQVVHRVLAGPLRHGEDQHDRRAVEHLGRHRSRFDVGGYRSEEPAHVLGGQLGHLLAVHALEVHRRGLLGGQAPALLVELRWDRSPEAAIAQARERDYPAVLRGFGGPVLLVGINLRPQVQAPRMPQRGGVRHVNRTVSLTHDLVPEDRVCVW